MQSLAPQRSAQAATISMTPLAVQSRSELVGQMNGVAGVETMLQVLLRVRAEIGGPDKAKAEREAVVREFHAAPITYDGFGVARTPPAMSVYILA